MRAFEDYVIGWEGKDYTIPANQLLPVIAAVEEHVTLHELFQASARNRVPLARLSQAYGAILRFAGVNIPDDQIYQRMFNGGNLQDKMMDAVNGLLGLMIPPKQEVKAQQPGKPQKGVKPSSKNSTKQRSARAG